MFLIAEPLWAFGRIILVSLASVTTTAVILVGYCFFLSQCCSRVSGHSIPRLLSCLWRLPFRIPRPRPRPEDQSDSGVCVLCMCACIYVGQAGQILGFGLWGIPWAMQQVPGMGIRIPTEVAIQSCSSCALYFVTRSIPIFQFSSLVSFVGCLRLFALRSKFFCVSLRGMKNYNAVTAR